MSEKILVTGGAGYVGSVLVPKLLDAGYEVRVLDTMWYGAHGLDTVKDRCEMVIGDIRDVSTVKSCLQGVNAIIHLAAVSNDPSSDLDPELTRQVNYYGTVNLVHLAKQSGVQRFIFASSSSVYGIKEEEQVTEDLSLEPLTVYSQTKEWAEKAIHNHNDDTFTTVVIRPATVCGYSPRQRLDVVVNIFTNHAVNKGSIRVNGGEQKRPNIHIADMADLYVQLLRLPQEKVAGKTFNFGGDNHSLGDLANMVKETVGENVTIDWQERRPNSRSYSISSKKIQEELGIRPQRSIQEAVQELQAALQDGRISNPDDTQHKNVARMKELGVTNLELR